MTADSNLLPTFRVVFLHGLRRRIHEISERIAKLSDLSLAARERCLLADLKVVHRGVGARVVDAANTVEWQLGGIQGGRVARHLERLSLLLRRGKRRGK